MHDKHWLVNKTVNGYKVRDPVGSGAMSWIYRAVHPKRGEAVLKFLKLSDDSSRHPEEQARFHAEARSMARIQHKNVVPVWETGTYEGIPYIVMPYLDGWDLREVLKQQSKLPWEKALFIASEVADGLGAIHAAGIIHRDIKPANVMIVKGGGIVIVDLGIAKRPNVDITQDGRLVATIAYSSPEQIRGHPLNARSDFFALGTLLYKVMTGRHPFLGSASAATIYNILEFEPPTVKEIEHSIPTEVSNFISQLIAKKTEDRPGDARGISAHCRTMRAGAGYGQATRVDLVLDEMTSLAADVFAGKYPFMLVRRDVADNSDWSVEASLAPFVCAPRKTDLKRMKFSLGRDNDNDVVIPIKICSRRHAWIFQSLSGGYLIEDDGSTNGTFVNDVQVKEAVPLKSKDVVYLGGEPPYVFMTSDDLRTMDISALGTALRRGV